MRILEHGKITIHTGTGEVEMSGYVFDGEGGPIELPVRSPVWKALWILLKVTFT